MKPLKPIRIYKASAGSGKTFTLAVEYITLLAMNSMAYQNILAVTFTNKATAEMKQRILGTLYGISHGLKKSEAYVEKIMKNIEEMKAQPQWQEEPYKTDLATFNQTKLKQRAHEALENIVHDYSRFHIETIDSFFQGIVRELANELELSTNMKVELDESEVLSEAIDQIIENLKEGSSEFRTIIEFIEEKIKESHSWQVNDTVKEFGKNIFKENYLIHGEKVREKITDSKAIFQYRNTINTYLEARKKAVTDLGSQMVETYEQLGITEKDVSQKIHSFMVKVRDYEIREPDNKSKGTFSDDIEEYITNSNKWFKKASKNRHIFQSDVETRLMPMLQETFEKHREYVSQLHTVNAISQHLYSLMLLNDISKTVKSLNDDNNRFLLSETANFLRNVINEQDIPFIYEKTGAYIKHIMIDEFQDTSTLQWDNFKPLILNSIATDGSCLIVGDVKQSIYRFRNSDWQILNGIEQDEDLKELIGKIPASYNYRSSKHIVDFNNKMFTNAIQLLQEECPNLSLAYSDVTQIANKNEEEGFVRIENIDYHGIDPNEDPDRKKSDSQIQLSQVTLERIQLSVRDLINNRVDPNDITILVRTNQEIPSISDYFNNHPEVVDVKVVSDDAFRLDASPVINIIICALRVLAEPDSLLYQATLTHLVGNIPQEFNEEARVEIRFKPITEQVEDIYQIFQLQQHPHQDAYLFYFTDIIAQFCEENVADLDTFLQAWDKRLCGKTIPNGTANGVRIMTMHKSKGLEFHSVIIPSCLWPIKPKDSEVMWCIPKTSPYDFMPLLPISVSKAKNDCIFSNDRKNEELKTLVDNINVLYVAFTRAKHNLIILTGNKLGEVPKENDKIENAQMFLIKSMPDIMVQKDIDGIITKYEYGEIVPTKQKAVESEKNVMECNYDPLPVSFASHPSIAEFKQSYDSDLFINEDSPNSQTQAHTERIRLISLGNLYHNIFQYIHTIEDVPHVIQMLESKGCFGYLLDAEEAREKVMIMIEDITDEHPEWFSKDWQALNERAILYLENQMLTTKRPDRVIVNNNQAIIIDYKTAKGVVKQNSEGAFSPPPENVHQMEKYKQLLAQIGYTEVRAYLWYILDHIIIPI